MYSLNVRYTGIYEPLINFSFRLLIILNLPGIIIIGLGQTLINYPSLSEVPVKIVPSLCLPAATEGRTAFRKVS